MGGQAEMRRREVRLVGCCAVWLDRRDVVSWAKGFTLLRMIEVSC
jgi:hypothetical protein